MDGYAGIFDNLDLAGALNAGVQELQQLVMTGQIDPNVLHQAAATAQTASQRLTTAANAAGGARTGAQVGAGLGALPPWVLPAAGVLVLVLVMGRKR